MASSYHTYGPTCALRPDTPPPPRSPTYQQTPPKVRAQFFYTSNLPIDDPLSPLPPPTTSTSVQVKVPPRPFSVLDNAALEEAWQSLQQTLEEKNEQNKGGEIQDTAASARRRSRKDGKRRVEHMTERPGSGGSAMGRTRRDIEGLSVGQELSQQKEPVTVEEVRKEDAGSGLPRPSSRRKSKSPTQRGRPGSRDEGVRRSPEGLSTQEQMFGFVHGEQEGTMSGNPFARAPSRRPRGISARRDTQGLEVVQRQEERGEDSERSVSRRPRFPRFRSDGSRVSVSDDSSRSSSLGPEHEGQKAYVPVGASRLHLVEMPELEVLQSIWLFLFMTDFSYEFR